MSLLARIEVIAHRGFSAVAPENTLAAFEAAISSGASRVELDVQLTRDGVPAVLHDDLIDRTTSGKGLVSEWTWNDLRRLDAGSWFHPRFREEKVPSLGEVLDLCRGRIAVNIEIKAGGTTGATPGMVPPEIEALVLREIAAREPGAEGWAIISSFDSAALERVRGEGCGVPLELLHDLPDEREGGPLPRPAALGALQRAEDLGARGLNVSLEEIRRFPDLPGLAHARSLRLKVYTVDDPEEMGRLLRLGVDGIFTNRPDELVRVLAGG